MARTQKFGIKYPFSADNDEEIYLDLNNSNDEEIRSKLLHILFTPKGQRLRNPNFGTDLIKYIFEQSDEITYEGLKADINKEIKEYLPEVEIDEITIYDDEKDEHGKIVIIKYSVTRGSSKITTSVGVKL